MDQFRPALNSLWVSVNDIRQSIAKFGESRTTEIRVVDFNRINNEVVFELEQALKDAKAIASSIEEAIGKGCK